VAIDAPLKVTNPDKMRPAESEITKFFGRFDAGAFPANTRLFPFPRGARLADFLGLDIDPRSGNLRHAIEVFPHPATVALFRLGRTFKYKARRGRTVDYRRSELLRLIDAIEGLASSSVPVEVAVNADWNHLRHNVEQATQPIHLRRAEDPIDAVMCAYIALYANRRPDDVTVYGNFPDNGYILTPTLPPDLEPAPRHSNAAAVNPGPATKLLPLPIAEKSDHCDALIGAVTAAWADIREHVFELGSIPTRDTTEVLVDSLTRVADVFELTHQELSSILVRVAKRPTDEPSTDGNEGASRRLI
jgi:predicted RNase H-like nuclease